MSFQSTIKKIGTVDLPAYTGLRIMMMPFRLDDLETVPYAQWRSALEVMVKNAPAGVGYLTIDEALIAKGETHRRPGLHVDGIGADGGPAAYGGGGGSYGANGMTMVSSVVGCRAWNQKMYGAPGPNGDCAHLAQQLHDEDAITLEPNTVYWCGARAVHEALPMKELTARKFCRVSYPSNAPWHEGYTPNPLGIKPTGPILPARTEFMKYRP